MRARERDRRREFTAAAAPAEFRIEYVALVAIWLAEMLADVPGPIDMATFYVPPEIGEKVIEEVARKGIAEVWLNPGAESDALVARAKSLNIRPIEACSIMAIGENPYAR